MEVPLVNGVLFYGSHIHVLISSIEVVVKRDTRNPFMVSRYGKLSRPVFPGIVGLIIAAADIGMTAVLPSMESRKRWYASYPCRPDPAAREAR